MKKRAAPTVASPAPSIDHEFKRICDHIEYFGRRTIQIGTEDSRKEEIGGLRIALRKFFNVKRRIDNYTTNTSSISVKSEEILSIASDSMSAAFLIGAYSTIPNSAARSLSVAQAETGRTAKKERDAIRSQKKRKAIIEAAAGAPLVASTKFADSIRDAVLRIACVDSESWGYSARSIQREINAILEERQRG